MEIYVDDGVLGWKRHKTKVGQTRCLSYLCGAIFLVATCSTPITVKVTHIRATITTIES
jgi:hypothetical protein